MTTYSRSTTSLVGIVAFAVFVGTPNLARNTPDGAASVELGPFLPCTLLSKEEVRAALGWMPDSTASYARPDGTGHCKYVGRTGFLRQIDFGIGVCPTNMPCTSLPDFATSSAMAQYRRDGYTNSGQSDLNPKIEPIEGLGVPAIRHELAGLMAIEMAIGHKRLAYVETFASFAAARPLAVKVLARAR